MNLNELFTPGSRHALDLIGMWIQQSGVKHVQIASCEDEVIKQILLRLPDGVRIDDHPEMVVYPFSLETQANEFAAFHVAGCFRNRYSYRRLIHPKMPNRDLGWLRSELTRSGYKLLDWRGIYPPVFLFWWILSVLAGSRLPALHFRFSEKAYQHLAKRSQFTHLIVFYARHV
jgi:hypothetical protein